MLVLAVLCGYASILFGVGSVSYTTPVVLSETSIPLQKMDDERVTRRTPSETGYIITRAGLERKKVYWISARDIEYVLECLSTTYYRTRGDIYQTMLTTLQYEAERRDCRYKMCALQSLREILHFLEQIGWIASALTRRSAQWASTFKIAHDLHAAGHLLKPTFNAIWSDLRSFTAQDYKGLSIP